MVVRRLLLEIQVTQYGMVVLEEYLSVLSQQELLAVEVVVPVVPVMAVLVL